jgi:flagellar biosynthesis protein FlgN
VEHISHTLIEVLNEQIRCAEAMLSTLGRENQALAEGDSEQLNAAGADKARLVETLETLESERRTLSDAIGASFAGDGAWQTLLELIAACKEQNQRNGALVKARSEQVRMALKVLHGTDEPECYDPTGMQSSARGARHLGSA